MLVFSILWHCSNLYIGIYLFGYNLTYCLFVLFLDLGREGSNRKWNRQL